MLEILRRVFLAILFLIAAIYASVATYGAVIAIAGAGIYTKCLFSTWFDFQHAGIMFDVLTRDFNKAPQDFYIMSSLFVGLPLGLWGGWHTITKGINPFKYMWQRD